MTNQFPPKRYISTATVRVVSTIPPGLLSLELPAHLTAALERQFGRENIQVTVSSIEEVK